MYRTGLYELHALEVAQYWQHYRTSPIDVANPRLSGFPWALTQHMIMIYLETTVTNKLRSWTRVARLSIPL